MQHRDYAVPFLAAILLLGFAGGICRGAPIAIANHSFESPVVAAGVFSGIVTDWQDIGAANDNGVFRGGGDFGQNAAPTDGSQIAFMNDLSTVALVQTLSTNYQAGLDYSLTVDIAARTTVGALDGVTLVLYRGSISSLASLAASNTVATFIVNGAAGLTNDTFKSFTLTATAANVAAVSGAGQAIGIGIIGKVASVANQNYDLDNVRLNAAQVYTPLQLSFKKDYQVRNYFNSSVPLSGLDLTQDVLAGPAHPRIHLTSPGCTFSQNGPVLQISNSAAATQESLISLGKIHNYAAIDLDLSGQTHTSGTATALLSLHSNANNRIVISQRDIDSTNKAISLTIIKNGTTVLSQTLSANGIAAPNTLRMHLTGVYLNFLTVKNGGAPAHLATIDISPHFDLRTKTLLDTFTLAAGARLASGESVSITRLEHFLTSGTSQADPKVIHYENAAPMVEGNTIWVAMTARGYGPIPTSYQSVYSYDLVTKVWKIAAVLAFDNGDGKLRPWCAGDVLFDRTDQKWKVFVTSHGDDHKIYYGESTNDLRNGHHRIAASLMNYASNGNEEDASVFYDEDAGKWRMALCRNSGGYQTVLFESASANGAWNQIGIYTPTSSTGILIQKIGGQRYVFLGRGASPCPMEVLSYPGMVKLGVLSLNVHPVGNNIWPAIIPLTYATGTKYRLLTFDRDGLFGGWSYGNIHWYEADEFASEFLEYENEVINPVENYASWIEGYDVGGETGISDDPDDDGIPNGVENYFGTNPGMFSTGLVAGSVTGDTFSFTHPLNETPASDLTAVYLWSKALSSFHADGSTDAGGTTVTFSQGAPSGGIVAATATVSGTSTSKLFVSVGVTRIP